MLPVVWFGLILFAQNGMTKPSTDSDLWQDDELLPVTKSPVVIRSPVAVASSNSIATVKCVRNQDSSTASNNCLMPNDEAIEPVVARNKSMPSSKQNKNGKRFVGSTSSFPFNATTLVDNISNQIRILLKHFQGPEPIGIPGQTILTEPLAAPNTTASMVVASTNFYNITIWGLSNFTINVVNTKLDDMEVYVELLVKKVVILGNYTVDNYLVGSSGPFNITLTNVTATGTVDLATNEEGKLYANGSTIDMTYKDIAVDLTDASSILRPFINGGGSTVLNAEKAHILENINVRLLAEIDHRLSPFPKIAPLKHISPVDLAITEARKFVRQRFEPYYIADVIDFENPFIKVHIGPVAVHGISKFARVGNVSLYMANSTVTIRIRIVTGRLHGNCKWYYDFGEDVGVKRFGQSNFTVEHLQFEAKINQSVDSRKSPLLDELEIETGPINVKMDGHGSFDYLVEMVVKLLPKMLRYTIIDALEEPLKQKVQADVLNKINVDQIFEENMSDIKKYLTEKIQSF